MRGRIKRTVGSLVIVLLCYSAYSVLAVPMLEPSVELAPPSDAGRTHVRSTSKSRDEFDALFPAGSWELERPKVLVTDRGKLIFDEYRMLPKTPGQKNSRMRLDRCTLILDRDDDGESNGRPIVLRATEGATLFFEGDLNISRGEFGRLIGVKVSTLRNWEQGRRRPTRPARTLFRVMEKNPMAVIEALNDGD